MQKNRDLWKIFFIVVVFLFIVLSRFAWLSEKPYHHDESQYASFSNYSYKGSLYKYDPILHGPFLFYFNMLIYAVFGINDFTARVGPALLGVLIPLIFLFMSRWLGTLPSFILIVIYAISPSFTYFNRFLSHDTYIAFFSVLFVYFFVEHIRVKKPELIYLASASLSFLFLIKVNSYIYTFVFFTFPIFLFLSRLPNQLETKKKDYLQTLKSQFIHIFLGTILFFLIFFIFYTSFFTNIPGFYDGLFIKSLGYWIGQHSTQRIKGDFDYYIPIIATYELPIMFIVLVGFISKIFRNKKTALTSGAIIAFNILLFLLLEHYWGTTTSNTDLAISKLFDKYLHMQYSYQLPMVLMFVYIGTYSIYSYIKSGELLLGFISYWFFLSLLIYSYAGEKVPWLSLNILMPMLFYSAVTLSKFLKSDFLKRHSTERFISFGLIILALTFTIFINYRVTIKYPADPKERLVFVQTSAQMIPLVNKVESIAKKTGEGFDLKIAVNGQAGWPLNWYLRNYKSIFPPPSIDDPANEIIVIDHNDVESLRALKEKYDYQQVKLREWWVPSKNFGFKELINYYFTRKVWSITGSYDVEFLVRKDISRGLR